MKKLLTVILILFAGLFLSACNVITTPIENTPIETPVQTDINSQTPTEIFDFPRLIGAIDLNYEIGDALPNYKENITALDYQDLDITEAVVVIDTDVLYQIPGEYEVIYQITDHLNQTTTVTITVTVKEKIEVINVINHLNIYYINDTHGNILSNDPQMGLARIANLILDERKTKNDNTLFIAGGDILQGSLISNYFKGESTMAALNAMGLDAFVLGNHEFDWGLETVTEYFNPNKEGLKANFKLLGANVFLKGTTNRPDFIDAYHIVQKGHVKVGIIGLMGYGLESSIAESMIKDYEFADPSFWAEHYARYLRTSHNVDIVLVAIHGSNSGNNYDFGSFTGDSRIDAIFNGHTHQAYVQTAGTRSVPVIQSGANSNFVGQIRLNISEDKMVTSYQATNLKASGSISSGISIDQRLNTPHPLVESIIHEYYLIVDDMLNTVITYSNRSYNQDELTRFISKLIRVEAEAAIGFHNRGGTRIPLSSGQAITVDTIYKLFPFDNTLYIVYMKGIDIKAFKNMYDGSFFDEQPGIVFLDQVYYKVAVTSYIYEKSDYPFLSGIDSYDTEILVRDMIIQEVMEHQEYYDAFIPSNPIIKSQEAPIPMIIFDDKRFYFQI
jgi:2',3'-cyclic-nucleotide 2'-phosphodiesterase (5'-nucleotidase family)